MAPTTVLITGANSGVGFAIATALAQAPEDFHVILASRVPSNAHQAISNIQSMVPHSKNQLSAVQLDVTDRESIRNAVSSVEKDIGRLDILINNAAIGCRDPDFETRLRLSFETNAIGPALVAQAFRPLLLHSQNPYSIYVSSGQGSLELVAQKGEIGLARGESYRASKSALNMLALNESIEFGEKLKVFVMCPGFVVSNLRGKDEASRSGWGHAKDPADSANLALRIIRGERDADVSKFVHTNPEGVYPW